MLAAFGADSFLPLVRFSFHVVGERTDIKVSFVTIQNIRIDSGLPGHIFVHHQLRNLFFQLVRVEWFALELIVQGAPSDPFHLLAILRERSLYPTDDALEIMPQRRRVLVMLML